MPDSKLPLRRLLWVGPVSLGTRLSPSPRFWVGRCLEGNGIAIWVRRARIQIAGNQPWRHNGFMGAHAWR